MDIADIDAEGQGKLYFGRGSVTSVSGLEGQKDVYLLKACVTLERETMKVPSPGEFYLLKSAKSSVQLSRPISVYYAKVRKNIDGKTRSLLLEFLILKKGVGTEELCSAQTGERIELIGPLGNDFAHFLPGDILSASAPEEPSICIIGGGIGVAPVAFFASRLKEKSYDFYASFKSGSYGLEYISPANLFVTTDDGSAGIRGMLPKAFNADCVKKNKYKIIFACGPSAMLSYVKTVAEECDVPVFMSVENYMACGVGACLGCTISTKDGVKRVCKDGPVFDGRIIEFPAVQKKTFTPLVSDVDLSVEIAGIHFRNPIIAASGTFGFGQNYRELIDVNALGGICSKGCTLEPRDGNGGRRIVEVPGGNINSIGLQNPGIPSFIKEELPEMLKLSPVSIANLAGSTLESYVEGAKLLDDSPVPMIELNISCPNVKSGGQAWGIKAEAARECVRAVRSATKKPLMVKLSPNSTELLDVALACIEEGADALSLINTIQAVSIDIEKGRPAFDNVRAGLCGPCIKPIALRMVYDVAEAVNKLPKEKRVPVVGIGGIANYKDAVEFIMAGAIAVQVGTATFSNPRAMLEIIEGLKSFMRSHGYKNIEQMRGIAQG